MLIELYKKPTGNQAEIEKKYYDSISILNRYTLKQLRDWKNVDLYFILNMVSFRDEQIDGKLLQEQYRNQLLRYQRQIRTASEVFLIINRAYNTLADPVKRAKFDSIFFDEEIPEDRVYDPEEFFIVFSDIFKKNANFSIKKPVPMLGSIADEKEEVEIFYRFWRNFESWRRFEYLDDDNTDGMNSADRRYYEKKNKANRDKKKKEDILRVKKLVEISLRRDPRVAKYKNNNSVIKTKITVNKKLINKNWCENDLLFLNDLIQKYKNANKYDWERIVEEFNKITANKKEEKAIIIKGNEILRMGIRNK